ncbi:MAG: T9SS type A sorting domain-containing protein [Vicingaceae bacterium]|nr:T9SS type A sorting domain-containing protein [Vicingaceae bacterium]
MVKFISSLILIFLSYSSFSQAYVKLVPSRDTINNCDNSIKIVPYGTTGPYVITWWDNHWQPSTGLKANNICEGTIISTELIDVHCQHLRNVMYVMPDSMAQLYLDTVIATLPSAPGNCDGSIEFYFKNVQSGFKRYFSTPSSGGLTNDSIFTGLCENDYTYSISGLPGWKTLGEVSVSLHYTPVLPCAPFTDSLVLSPISAPGNCDGVVTYNTSGTSGSAPYLRSIYKPIGSASVQVNSGLDTSSSFSSLCAGPHIIYSQTYGSNRYFTSSTIFVDNPVINDSTWGSPSSNQIDTILLSAITNCGINYDFNVDTVFISQMNHIAGNQFEFEITVIQDLDSISQTQDTIYNYETAAVDTSHQLCFDITFFCADSSGIGSKTINSELHSYIYFPSGPATSINKYKSEQNNFDIYPVPTSGYLNISNLPNGINQLRIFSIEGKEYLDKYISETQLRVDMSKYPSGMYFISVKNQFGYYSTKKVILNN